MAHRLRNHQAPPPGAWRGLQIFALKTWKNLCLTAAAKRIERSAQSRNRSRAIGTRGRPSGNPSHTQFAPPQRVQEFIPLPANPPHPAAAKPTPAIAPAARRVNVGLTVNRDDHVTKIPVVFAFAPPHSQES